MNSSAVKRSSSPNDTPTFKRRRVSVRREFPFRCDIRSTDDVEAETEVCVDCMQLIRKYSDIVVKEEYPVPASLIDYPNYLALEEGDDKHVSCSWGKNEIFDHPAATDHNVIVISDDDDDDDDDNESVGSCSWGASGDDDDDDAIDDDSLFFETAISEEINILDDCFLDHCCNFSFLDNQCPDNL